MATITFKPVTEKDLPQFKKRLQTAFDLAVVDENGNPPQTSVVPDNDIEVNYYADGAETYDLHADGQLAGGVILTIDNVTNQNHLDFFFIDPQFHNKGFGYDAWCAIEARYPNTAVWHTGTPYFEKRNIHFYVNKCGFKINEFYCKGHPEPNCPEDFESESGMQDGFFCFEKIM